jgi:hypothetical protein
MNIRHAIMMIRSYYTKGHKHLHYQEAKVNAMYLYNPTFFHHLTVPVFHTMIHSCHIGYQHMSILFAPSVMLNMG